MSFGQWYISRGRIDRRTYWLRYFLPIAAVLLLAELVVVLTSPDDAGAAGADSSVPGTFWLFALVWLAALPPAISAQVTRLHDRGRSAWWLLLSLVPLVGGITLLVFMCLAGDPGPNRYGPPPTGPRSPEPDPAYPQYR